MDTAIFGNAILFVLSIAFSGWLIRETVDRIKGGEKWHKWGASAAAVSGITAAYLAFVFI